MANNKAIMKHMQNEFQFSLVWVLTNAALGHLRFYNFSIEITFLPYKSTMISLCGPPDFSAFLHSCMYILNTNIAHIIPTTSQYSDHCLGVVRVAREHFSGVYCCLFWRSLHKLIMEQLIIHRPLHYDMILSLLFSLPLMVKNKILRRHGVSFG